MSLSRILNDDPAPAAAAQFPPPPLAHHHSPTTSHGTPPVIRHLNLAEPPLQPYPQKAPPPYASLPEWQAPEARNDRTEHPGHERYSSAYSNGDPGQINTELSKSPRHGQALPIWTTEVEHWFEAGMVERNQGVAKSLSHHYASKLAKLPGAYMRQRSPSPASSYGHGENGTFAAPGPPPPNNDGFRDFEPYTPPVRDLPKPPYTAQEKGKGKEVAKRVASDAVSDATSDSEHPAAAKRGRPAKNAKSTRFP
ncbi:hypothetical protein MKEN_01297200 [Mycena kentingensis (nom. inval.)]|nr:hypothetical protein MKEN_01297200 [Mycena kentingensis (nom. inval.)]